MTRDRSKMGRVDSEVGEDRDRSLAHKLLIELLSYQFASPVKWIGTQNEILSDERDIRRYVEVGPAKILSTMASKTAARKNRSRSSYNQSKTKFMAYNDENDDIYYLYPEDEMPQKSGDSTDSAALSSEASTKNTTPVMTDTATSSENVKQSSDDTAQAAAQSPSVPTINAPQSQTTSTPTAVPDIKLSAEHVLFALAGQKLKRAFDDIPKQKTIRELSGGKSTLQNELIGDLGAEFGSLPDGAEDLSLEALASALQANFSGKPGKQMSSLIARLMAGSMPAGFNQAAMQEHALAKWGLTPDHSQVVVCLAVSAKPPARLADPPAAQTFIDSLITRYGSFAGLSLTPAGSSGAGPVSEKQTTIDSASLDAARKEERDLKMKEFQLLAKYLQIPLSAASDGQITALKASNEEMTEALTRWNTEFDEKFFDGIVSAFDVQKSRTFDSWWNWAREDLVRLLYEISLNDREDQLSDSQSHRLMRIENKWDSSCAEIVDFFANALHSTAQGSLKSTLQRLRDPALVHESDDVKFRYRSPTMRPQTSISPVGDVAYSEAPRQCTDYNQAIRGQSTSADGKQVPFIHIRHRSGGPEWNYDADSTTCLLDAVDAALTSGIDFTGKTALVTGAGPKSIGSDVIQGLLSGGAKVIATTSRAISSTAAFYQDIFRTYGAKGASLTILTFNQSSKKDCQSLIEYMFGNDSPTGGNLDYFIPFAAIPDTGELDGIDGISELAHRAMLVNVLRLLGYLLQEKEQRQMDTRPTMVILPLSPNHGTFGGDGLYSESKLGLETLMNRFYSESWASYITICGAVIGWTRGTGLMSQNNIVAEAIEKHGVLTFSQSEMALNILALLTPYIATICEDDPVYADLSGGLHSLDDLKQKISDARLEITEQSQLRKALHSESLRHETVLKGATAPTPDAILKKPAVQRANLNLGFPHLPERQDFTDKLKDLRGMVDLSRIPVVVGFSELGPLGSARTRWEAEHLSELSLEGYVEMAWIMGLVRYAETSHNGEPYVGWIDVASKEPVKDEEFKSKYHEHIMCHSGLRFIEPESLGGYDPSKKEFLHEVAVEEDLPAFESSQATAEAFKLRHGKNVTIEQVPGSDLCKVQVKKGAHFLVPKAVPFDRTVAGQLPRGWDPIRYGIPEDIVQQVDPITLYMLCCVSEALLSATITDPFEIYEHTHVSDLINCLGTGAGSLLAMRGVYQDRYLDREVQGDILQESFLNTMGAWVNMLLLSSNGPIRSPVGACATAFESLDMGCEAIESGKSTIAFVGGSDDFQEEMSYEFGQMKATTNTVDELSMGRLPKEMSRPSSSTRSGFVESAGCGAQILMSAELALKMGLPIYGIIAYTQMASDKIGRSIPAPGKGILTAAREASMASTSSLLDLEFRRKNLMENFASIQQWQNETVVKSCSLPHWSSKMYDEIQATATSKMRQAQQLWGNDIRLQDPTIAPLRAALATWSLTIDDITVISMHGTSTKANDLNEADVVNQQMTHLGRSAGNPLLVVCQKSLTGHPKGAAGAWQMNGCLQMMQSHIVPGNRNADNVDTNLRKYTHLVYPMEPIKTRGIKATMATSFGFGQKGAVTIAVAPSYLFSAVEESDYTDYRRKVMKRQHTANLAFQDGLMNHRLFKAKNHAPVGTSDSAFSKTLLDPNARLPSSDSAPNPSLPFSKPKPHEFGQFPDESRDATSPTPSSTTLVSTVHEMLGPLTNAKDLNHSIGVDIESIANIPVYNDTFISRNFTEAEQEYCHSAPDPSASFAGRWSAKEAVFKSLRVPSRGAGAGMREIEILSEGGIPVVQLHGKAEEVRKERGIGEIKVSISHSEEMVTAVALAGSG